MNALNKTHNITYKTEAIKKFFEKHRNKWEDFYPSEKWAFEKIAKSSSNDFGRVLDAGCAMGSLGLVLSEKFNLKEYVGIDINKPVIESAKSRIRKFSIPVKFKCGDILLLNDIGKEYFDNVFSLSCADWNIETNRILNRCWEFVNPGGNFIISLRLTNTKGINDITKSYQAIAYDKDGHSLEDANYVVFNYKDFFTLIENLKPRASLASSYGYWRNPASNATTPYDKLVFAVFIIKKNKDTDSNSIINTEFILPLDLFTDKNI